MEKRLNLSFDEADAKNSISRSLLHDIDSRKLKSLEKHLTKCV